MGSRISGRVSVAWILASLCAGVSAAPAQADYTYPRVQLTAGDNSITTGDVACPTSVPASSGGLLASGGYDDGLFLQNTRRGLVASPSTADAWTAGAENEGPGGAGSNTVYPYAVCDGDVALYSVHQRDAIAVADGGSRSTQMRCGRGEVPTGGGVSLAANQGLYVATSAPFDDRDDNREPDGWKVVVENALGGNAAAYVATNAVCDAERGFSDYRFLRDSFRVSDASLRRGGVRCPGDHFVAGGGVRSNSEHRHALRVQSTYPTGGADPPYGWKAGVTNIETPSASATRTFTVTAICRA